MGGMASPETAPGEVLVAVVSIKDLIPAVMVPCGEGETTGPIPSPSGSGGALKMKAAWPKRKEQMFSSRTNRHLEATWFVY